MTKKDYELIAEVERNSYDVPYSINETSHIHRLADALQANDPKFDRNKFLQACGIEQHVGKFAADNMHDVPDWSIDS